LRTAFLSIESDRGATGSSGLAGYLRREPAAREGAPRNPVITGVSINAKGDGSGGEIMQIRHWALAMTAALAVAPLARAQVTDAGVTDLTKAPPGAIMAADIVEALAVPRGTRINPSAPPQVRLPIYFEFDSATPTPEARALLEQVGGALQSPDLESFHFLVEGHTDDLGSEDYNQELSIARARAVAAYLEGKGVAETRLRATGKGESSPVAPNENEEGRRRNRRVDFINLGVDPEN
jgi:outer membrane protein OmpA-like peptidoglycan-associated protein